MKSPRPSPSSRPLVGPGGGVCRELALPTRAGHTRNVYPRVHRPNRSGGSSSSSRRWGHGGGGDGDGVGRGEGDCGGGDGEGGGGEGEGGGGGGEGGGGLGEGGGGGGEGEGAGSATVGAATETAVAVTAMVAAEMGRVEALLRHSAAGWGIPSSPPGRELARQELRQEGAQISWHNFISRRGWNKCAGQQGQAVNG